MEKRVRAYGFLREKIHIWLLSLQFIWRSTCSSEKEEEGEWKRRKRRRRKLGFEVWLRFGISFFYFVFVGVMILFWILNGGVWCEKCVKKTCRCFKGFVVKIFLKPMFLFWPYLDLETSKLNDSNWRGILRPVALNI